MAFLDISSIEGIITGILTNGLTSLIGHFYSKEKGIINLEDNLRHAIEENVNLKQLVKHIDFKNINLKKLRSFLNSPEIESIIREIYAYKINVDYQKTEKLQEIKTQLLKSLALFLSKPEEELQALAVALFQPLEQGCNQVLDATIKQGNLFSHEIKEILRFNKLYDELSAIKKTIKVLEKNPNIDLILEFEEKYRNEVGVRHGKISPPLSRNRIVRPINELYVPPNLSNLQDNKFDLELVEFYSNIYRTVLLGNPGGGKSTFTEKLCFDISNNYSSRFVGGRELTPIIVVLREYVSDKIENNFSILKHIESKARSKYQIEYIPEYAFEYMLLNGRAMVIFDGLDELIETYSRQEISKDIMSFCNHYPNVPILVTSREVGYEQAPLDEQIFEVYKIAPFNEHQVKKYAEKWFSIDRELTDKQKNEKVKSFVNESGNVHDIRSNPLMLSLMCNIYRDENYIPQNRPSLYRKCSELLFEKWDGSRGIRVQLPKQLSIDRLRFSMMYLAHYIYNEFGQNGNVSEERLIKVATDYLNRRIDDLDEAESYAKHLINFCKGRAWVFTNVGTIEGEERFQFTHQTFLEYFTAVHLVRIYKTDELSAFLFDKIRKREWDVVSQLAFQIKAEYDNDAENELLQIIIDKLPSVSDSEKWHLISFAIRSLDFLNPSPNVIYQITKTCITFILTGNMESRNGLDTDLLISQLLSAPVINRLAIRRSLETVLTHFITENNIDEIKILAIELNCNLSMFYSFGVLGRSDIDTEISEFWEELSSSIFDLCENEISKYYTKDFGVAIFGMHYRKITLIEIIEWYGIESLFVNKEFNIGGCVRTQLSYQIMGIYLGEITKSNIEIDSAYLVEKFLSTPMPWFLNKEINDHHDSPDWLFIKNITGNSQGNIDEFTANEYFILFILSSVSLELSNQVDRLINSLKESRNQLIINIRNFLISKFEEVNQEDLNSEFYICKFTDRQREFISRWITNEFNYGQETVHNL